MLPTYNHLVFARVKDLANFYKDNASLPETPKLRGLIDNSKLLFSLPSNRVALEVVEGERIYRISLMSPDVNRLVFGWLVYIPQNRQLEIYTPDDPNIPLIQFKSKKAVFKNYSTLLDRAGLDTIFSKLYNVL